MDSVSSEKEIIIIFGGSGHLAKTKLIPALSRLKYNPQRTVIAYGRSSIDKYVEMLKGFYSYQDKNFLEKVKYVCGSYDNLEGLKEYFTENTVCYLSVPPDVYLEILKGLEKVKVRSIAIEKPYAMSYEKMDSLYKYKDRIEFVDHYLYKQLIDITPVLLDEKEEVENIDSGNFEIKNIENYILKKLSFPLRRKILESYIIPEYIHMIRGFFLETVLVEGREYYLGAGCTRDVVQNHLMGFLLYALGFKKFKDEITESIIESMVVEKDKIVFGKYAGYLEENKERICPETFMSVVFRFQIGKWSKIPIFLAAGKALMEKKSEIGFVFRESSFKSLLNSSHLDGIYRNRNIENIEIVLNASPDAEIYIEIKEKIEGRKNKSKNSTLDTSEEEIGRKKKFLLITREEIENISTVYSGENGEYMSIFEDLIGRKKLKGFCFGVLKASIRKFEEIINMKIPYYCYKEKQDKILAKSQEIFDITNEAISRYSKESYVEECSKKQDI